MHANPRPDPDARARSHPRAPRGPAMSWTGKAVGALLGLLTRRWQFVVMGLVIGHLFDLGLFGSRSVAPPPPPPADDDPYRILDVDPAVADADIEAAYRRLIAQYHPDRVANAAPEIVALAETRARAINQAYERIQKIRRGSR
jgi:DnaJ-domain-containing protein 1